jgi:hypothetical protein
VADVTPPRIWRVLPAQWRNVPQHDSVVHREMLSWWIAEEAMRDGMADSIFETIMVEPTEGRETQLVHWFRLCVAEWHNGVSPRLGLAEEELLIWDKGRERYLLETHWYGREQPHRCERTLLDHESIRAWIVRRGSAIVWRDDAQAYYPLFVHARPGEASAQRVAA